MDKRLNSKQRNYIIIGLCAILVIMGVGYAAFQSQLKITGTSNIASNFLVKITSITPNSIVGTALDKPEITTYNDTSATFGVSLKSPGDSITYDITIENKGTIDAVLKTITKTDTNNSAILFETSGVNENDELKVGETATMKVKVTYNPEITSQPTDLDSTLNIELDYEQSTGEVVPTPTNPTIGGQEVEVVESGDGLYEDEYEEGRYVYRGANPNNYIMFNDELWRIIAKETDGTYKILRNELLPDRSFDSRGARTTGYCSQGTAPSIGCNAWSSTVNMVGSPAEFTNGTYKGSVDKDSEMLTYLNGEYLNSITTNQDKIVSHTWSIGAVTWNNSDLAGQINGEKAYQWNGKVGLISHSDYIRANSNQSMCGTAKINYENYDTCRDLDWMYISGPYWWSLSPGADSTYSVFFVVDDGHVINTGAYNSLGVRPAIYLSSDISLSGLGTQESPFTIVS